MTELSFLPHVASVAASGQPPPSRWMLVLHGILGSGANWRTLARRLADERPAWGFLLVDLREHGASTGAPPPHTIEAAARDLEAIRAPDDAPVAGVLGHSFGGKVALAFADARAASNCPLDRAFVLDASPSARVPGGPESTADVVRMLRSLPMPLPSRERFFELVGEQGHSRPFAEWLAMNVRRAPDGFRLRVDLDAIDAMLADYFSVDLWAAVARIAERTKLGFVLGGRSAAISTEDRARLEALAATLPRLEVHVLPEAGHWLHVDDPEGLLAVLRDALGESVRP